MVLTKNQNCQKNKHKSSPNDTVHRPKSRRAAVHFRCNDTKSHDLIERENYLKRKTTEVNNDKA